MPNIRRTTHPETVDPDARYFGARVRITDLSRDHGLTGRVFALSRSGPLPVVLVHLEDGRRIVYRADQVTIEPEPGEEE